MPGFNGTGPQGQGPMTGRGYGRCRPVNKTENEPSVISNHNPTQMQNENIPEYRSTTQVQTYGVGRGGVPCGCGRGCARGGRGGRRGR